MQNRDIDCLQLLAFQWQFFVYGVVNTTVLNTFYFVYLQTDQIPSFYFQFPVELLNFWLWTIMKYLINIFI